MKVIQLALDYFKAVFTETPSPPVLREHEDDVEEVVVPPPEEKPTPPVIDGCFREDYRLPPVAGKSRSF